MGYGPNILFIVIDALRVDGLSCYQGEAGLTPHIDALAANGVLFEDAYSCSNATDASLTTIFSGMYPHSHGVIRHGVRVEKDELMRIEMVTFLAEALRGHGYKTYAIDWMGRWHRRGFDYYSGILTKGGFASRAADALADRLRLRGVANWALRASKGRLDWLTSRKLYDNARLVTDAAIAAVRELAGVPFYLFLHYWDPHAPYAPPALWGASADQTLGKGSEGTPIEEVLDRIGNPSWRDHLRRSTKGHRYVEQVIEAYRSEIRFVDNELGRLVEILRGEGLLDSTLMILTADHGESLMEHGIYFDHHGLYDCTIHIPLILHYPQELPGGQRVEGFVQHVDVMPTIMEMVGIGPLDQIDGESLLGAMSHGSAQIRSSVFAEEALTQRKRAIRTKEYKYIQAASPEEARCCYCDSIHGGEEELYRVSTDPGETINLADRELRVCREMKGLLPSHLKDPGLARGRGQGIQGDLEVVRKLEGNGIL